MLFTSKHIAPNTTPSIVFKERGNTTDGPSKLGELPIYQLPKQLSQEWKMVASNLGQIASASISGTILPSNSGYFPFINFGSEDETFLLRPYPPVGVSFTNKKIKIDDLEQALNQLSFTKESKGRAAYYRGITM